MRSHGWKLWGAALCALTFVACGGDSNGDGDPPVRQCQDRSECRTDEICLANVCVAREGEMCGDDFDCTAGDYCAEGTCSDAACEDDSACAGGAICDDVTKQCGAGCRTTSDCDGSEVCNATTNVCELPGCLAPGAECVGRVQQCDATLSPPACVSTGACRFDAGSPQLGDNDCALYGSELDDGEDYVCGPDGQCALSPPCADDTDCADNRICEPRASDDRRVCRIGCREADPTNPDNRRRRCEANEICDVTGAFTPPGAPNPETFVCVEGCSSSADCQNLLNDFDNEYFCDQAALTCKVVCDDTDSRSCDNGTVCRAQAGSADTACDSCEADEQCLATEFCNFELGINPGDIASPTRGLCEQNPPACPEDAYGMNTALGSAFEVAALPFVADGSADFDQPLFCRENDDFGEWFEVTLTEGTIFTARLEYASAGGNLDLALKNEGGADLVASARIPDRDQGVEEIRYGISATGTYYVQVRGVIQSPNTPYSLSMSADAPGACETDALEGAGNNTAADAVPLLPDTNNAGLKVCAGDADYYAIEVGANQVASVVASASARLGGVELTVFDPDGNPVGTSFAAPDSERVEFTTSTPGTYIVEIRVRREPGFNDYSLRWSQRPDECADPYEMPPANDNAQNAKELPFMQGMGPNDSVANETSLRVCTDTDWYRVTLQPEEVITVSATYSQNPLTGLLDLRLRGPNNPDIIAVASMTETGMISDPTRTETLTYNTGRLGGVFYIAVTLNQGSNVEYDLDVSIDGGDGCTDDVLEENDTAATATQLSRAALAAGDATENAKVGLQICDSDQDFYAVTLQAGDGARFVVRHSAAMGLNINAQLIAPDGTTTDYVTTTDDEEIVITNAMAGTYTLRVFGAVPLRNAYNLLTYLTPAGGVEIGPADPDCPDQFEDNDDRASAVPIAPGSYSLLACGRPVLDNDWYRILLGPGETLDVSVTSIFSRGNIDLLLYDDSGSLTPTDSSVSARNLEQIIYTSARQQEVLIHVRPSNTVTTNAYTLDVAVTPAMACPVDAAGSNSTGATAAPITSPGFLSRLVKCETSDDWYSFDATAGQRVGVYLSFRDAGDLDLTIYDNAAGTGTPVATGTVSALGEGAEFVPAATGTYYVRVSSAVPTRLEYDVIINRDLDLSGTFDLGEGVLSKVCPDRFEDNDTPQSATPIAAGTYGDLRMCVYAGVRDRDIYTIDVPDGATLTVDLAFIHDDGNIDLIAQTTAASAADFAFERSMTSSSMQNSEQVTYTNSSGSTQPIRITVNGGAPTGYDTDYSMTVTLTP